MAQKVICDPTSTTIFEVCEFIRTEAENLTRLQAESQQAEKEQNTEKAVSLKNATMKLQQGNATQECVHIVFVIFVRPGHSTKRTH